MQAICDRLGPATIQVFAERWWSILPLPLTEHDRAAGYWWELSMRQVETSRTLVFDAPRHARGFFEALVTDNLDIGRPEVIELIFRRGQRRGRPATGEFKTKVVTYGTAVNVNAFYRHSRIKQYLKDGRHPIDFAVVLAEARTTGILLSSAKRSTALRNAVPIFSRIAGEESDSQDGRS